MTAAPAPPLHAPLTLAIEVSNPSSADDRPNAPGPKGDVAGPSVALARGSVVLDQEPLHTPDSRHDDDLMPAIDRLVRRAGFSPVDLRRVAVSIGPGGFTGLRVAIATAKAIGEAIAARGHAPACCIPVASALVAAHNCIAARRGAPAPSGPFAVALASKRDTVWLTLFNAGGEPISPSMHHEGPGGVPGRLATADDLGALHSAHAFGTLLSDRFLPEAHRRRADQLGVVVAPLVLSGAACARASHGIVPLDPADLSPLYPREPEAVTKWRALHPPGLGQ